MGTAGSGKSTVIRSLISDYIRLNQDSVYCWLSEESIVELQEGMGRLGVDDDDLSKLIIESELDDPDSTARDIVERVLLTGAKILIIDNITTSRFYMDKKISEQSVFITSLKKLAAKHDLAIILVAHTRKDIHDNFGKLITENDIRGCSSVVNMAHFFYVLQRFKTNGNYYPTLRILKHRGYAIEETMYFLQFDMESLSYSGDLAITFDIFKKNFKGRDNLNG
jgi:RecA-family ATPase